MRFQTRGRHVIDLVFPIALFFVFAASALIVLILAADLYGTTTSQLRVNDENRSALAYIEEKIRQNDTNGALRIISIEDRDCLAMSADYNGISYTTYIYEYEGILKELFIRDDVSFSLKNGRDIMEISSLTMTSPEDRLYRFTVTDSEGLESSLIASERSAP
ncbi:MAG: DUF4860 domain-containing protein [Lachnospiraceae bacterium]|nr:DUF4860 domain-containing protein [Lachnospiraceae bacterium]